MKTTAYQLADLKTADQGGIIAYIAERRPSRSWRLISRDLYEDTGLDITFETLRKWHAANQAKAAS